MSKGKAKSVLPSLDDEPVEQNYRAINFVGTWFDYPDDWKQVIEERIADGVMKWFAGEEEICPDTGKPHIQCFFGFENARKTFAVRKKFKMWCYRMNGRIEDNEKYCSKEQGLWKCGEIPRHNIQNGKDEKDRWQKIWDLSKSGKFEEIEPEVRFKHFNNVLKVHAYYDHDKTVLDKLDNLWIWGDPMTGKSEMARSFGPAYDKPLNKWWDGYQGEAVVILDDWDIDTGKYIAQYLKRWADKYPFPAEKKGTLSHIRPKRIVVTSNYPIAKCFPEEALRKAIERRFTVIETKFDSNKRI